MNEITRKEDVVIWQQSEEGVGEPALLVSFYNDVIQIKQENRYVQLNYETVQELCKILKSKKQP